jgi:uncharacterized protein (DUF1330 family)
MLRHAILCLPFLFGGVSAHAQTGSTTSAYLVAEFEVTDPVGFKKFAEATNAPVKAHGGEFLARLNKVIPAAGDPPKSVAIIRFPSAEKAEAYLASAEYKALVPERDRSSKFRSFIAVGGDMAGK